MGIKTYLIWATGLFTGMWLPYLPLWASFVAILIAYIIANCLKRTNLPDKNF